MRSKVVLLIACGAALLCAAGAIGAYALYKQQVEQNSELQEQLEKLARKEKQSTVMQRVNAQMEEIANEERRISEEQRDAAEQQTRVAEEMRRKAEAESHNALIAEHKALEASEVAQRERAIAEHQRADAEQSKRVADTLSYLSLARTLGNTAINQYRSDNHEVADLLAYMACLYTERYKGDIYSPTVYQALAMTSQNKTVFNKHKGSVTDIAFADQQDDYLVTCSTYGEISKHTSKGGKLTSTTLVSDPKYDFRDLYIIRPTNTIYALSRSGHLLVISPKGAAKVVEISLQKLRKMDMVGNQFIIFAEQGMALFDTEKNVITKTKPLSFTFVNNSRYQNYPVIFDNKGRMHTVKSFDNIQTSQVPVKGQVTAFAESKNKHIKCYGMSDGTVYMLRENGDITKLQGHRSRISKLKINGHRIYSSSYDGALNLWMTNMPKIEPMTLFTTKGWIINFTFDLDKTHIWSGDQNGNLTTHLIAVDVMKQRLKAKLKRNLTRDEWNYFIGKNVPYEKIKDEK
jgi:hypothetical protein